MKGVLKGMLADSLLTANICDAGAGADIYWASPVEDAAVMPNILTFVVAKFSTDLSYPVKELKKKGLVVGVAARVVTDPPLPNCSMMRVSFGDDVDANAIKSLGRALIKLIT